MTTTLIVETNKLGFIETVRREMRLRNYAHKTIKSYLSCLRSFVAYEKPKHPRDVTTEIYTHVSKKSIAKIVSPLDSAMMKADAKKKKETK